MPLTWEDAEDIAIQLAEKRPDLDPLTVRFVDLHKMVMDLPDFKDDAKRSNEGFHNLFHFIFVLVFSIVLRQFG